jgi:RNA polymerase sigma factor (sigma-70 family)
VWSPAFDDGSPASSLADDALARAPVRRLRLVTRSTAVKRDAAAFAAVYEDNRQALYRYLRSILRHDQDAQDALQSTMTRAFAALRDEPRDFELRPWLFRIAHNEAVSLLRRRQITVELEDSIASERACVEEKVAEREDLRVLRRDLADLPDRQRAALVLREFGGLGHREIGLALGCSPSSAQQAIADARDGLQRRREGRAMPCETVRSAIASDDGRVLRGRRLRAHLAVCAGCRDFQTAVRGRPRWPLAIPLPFAALLRRLLAHKVSAGGLAAGGGVAGGVAVPTVATVAVVATVVAGALSASGGGPPAGKPAAAEGVRAVAAGGASTSGAAGRAWNSTAPVSPSATPAHAVTAPATTPVGVAPDRSGTGSVQGQGARVPADEADAAPGNGARRDSGSSPERADERPREAPPADAVERTEPAGAERGRSTTAPGRVRGRSDTSNGRSEAAHGRERATRGRSGTAPGRERTARGGRSARGRDGAARGGSRPARGRDGAARGGSRPARGHNGAPAPASGREPAAQGGSGSAPGAPPPAGHDAGANGSSNPPGGAGGGQSGPGNSGGNPGAGNRGSGAAPQAPNQGNSSQGPQGAPGHNPASQPGGSGHGSQGHGNGQPGGGPPPGAGGGGQSNGKGNGRGGG